MNGFEYLEHRRKLLIGGTVIICLALLAVTIRRYNVAYDSFWHLKIGLDWLEYGLSPWRDHYSFTFNGTALNPPFIFEAILGWLVMNFGLEPGFQIYKLSCYILTFGLVLYFLRKLQSKAVVYCLVLPLLVVLLQLRSIVRPELLSYAFIALSVILYHRARRGMSVANMLPIVVLMLVWSNYHSPIFGYVIFLGYFIDRALQQLRDRESVTVWLQWLGWGLAIIAVGFLHPGFGHPVIGMLFFPAEWKQLIQEYQSAIRYRQVAAIYALIAISLLTFVLLIRKREFGLLFVCCFLIYHSVEMVRLVAPSGIVILCIFAWMMSQTDLDFELRRLPEKARKVTGVAVLAVFVLSLMSAISLARLYMKQNRISGLRFPEDVVDYMVDQDISGRIFNSYDAGGYLIYRLSPDSQVYIDGRTGILYPLEHFYKVMDAERSPDVLIEEIEKYDINLAVLKNSQANYSLARDTQKLGLDYIGAKFSLFTRDQANFPVLGDLLAYPACWNFGQAEALKNEQQTAIALMPAESQTLAFIRYVIDYDKSDEKITFIKFLEDQPGASDELLRFAGHQAIVENLYSSAYKLFLAIKEKAFSDYLGGALASARMSEWKTAEEMLDMGTRFSWSEKKFEISILHQLLTQIHQNSELSLFDVAYMDRLAEEIDAGDVSKAASFPMPQDFCPDS